jgi:cytochrome P450
MEYPASPAAAVTHPNPYPYYAGLIARHPFEYDAALGCWVAASAEAVTAVLTNPVLRVRPPDEPVPKTLDGLPAGDIFRRLVRMNDGSAHDVLRQAVSSTLMPVDRVEAGRLAGRWAKALFDDLRPDTEPERLSDFAAQLPLYGVGSLLGIPDENLPQIVVYISQFVACLVPGTSPERLEQGRGAAVHLLDSFHALLNDERRAVSGGLLHQLARRLRSSAAMRRPLLLTRLASSHSPTTRPPV